MLDKRRSRYVRSKMGTICRSQTASWWEDAGYAAGGMRMRGCLGQSLGRLLKLGHFASHPLPTAKMEDAVQHPWRESLRRIHQSCKRLHDNQPAIPVNRPYRGISHAPG